MTKFSKAYLCLLIDVPCERDSIVGDFLYVADGIKAFFVVSCGQKKMLRLALKDQGKRGYVKVLEENRYEKGAEGLYNEEEKKKNSHHWFCELLIQGR